MGFSHLLVLFLEIVDFIIINPLFYFLNMLLAIQGNKRQTFSGWWSINSWTIQCLQFLSLLLIGLHPVPPRDAPCVGGSPELTVLA